MAGGRKETGIPRLAEALLRLAIRSADVCEGLLGDLEEDCADTFEPGSSRLRKSWWYWRAIVVFSARSVLSARPAAAAAGRAKSTQEEGWGAMGRVDLGGAIEGWARQMKLAVRSLARRPGFSALAIITLALGIGANTAIFSVIYGSLLRPLPYADADRLVYLSDGHENFGGAGINMSLGNLADLREGSRLLESSAMYSYGSANLSTSERPERAMVLLTSSELLSVLGVAPRLGRDFLPGDDQEGSETVAILMHGLWQSRFGGDPGVVGQTTLIDAAPVRVVGVAPEAFSFPGDPDILMPLQHEGTELSHIYRDFNAVGRLAPGAEVETLRAELQGIFQGLAEAHPEANDGWFTWADPLATMISGSNRSSLLLLGGSVLLVLIIACVNVANLLLVRAESRQRELAVRVALGVGRSGLLAHFLSEGLVLSLLGGVAGVLAAVGGVDLLVALYGGSLNRANEIGVNGTVLVVSLGVSIVVGLVVGLIPFARAHPDRLSECLKEGARGSSSRGSRLGQALVITEVALALVIVAGAGLLMNSMWRVQQQELGISDVERVLSFRLSLPDADYEDEGAVETFHTSLIADLQRIQGVEAVGLTNRRPLLGGFNREVALFGDPERSANFVSSRAVTRGYFDATGAPLLAGRWLTDAEFADGAYSTLINETLARALFAGEDPLGQRLDLGYNDDGVRIVGVVGDIVGFNPDRPAPGAFYYPMTTTGRRRAFAVLMKTAGDPNALVPTVRRTVESLDPGLPVYSVMTMEEVALLRLGQRRFAMSLFGVFAALALLLGAVGIYGVMSVSVARRSREMGVRIALGASQRSVLRLVLADGARLTVPGIVIGVVLALASGRFLGSLLYQVSALDPLTYLTVAALLTLIAMAATWVPARRATRVHPVESIRNE